MRNVKVIVQADTAQAMGSVRMLTGALERLDAAARQSAQNALQALSGAGVDPKNIVNIDQQAAAAAQAKLQADKISTATTKSPDKIKTEKDTADRVKKQKEKLLSEGEKEFKKFADEIGGVFADAFEGLLQGGLKGGLKGLKDSLKSMLQGIMKQLIGNIAEQIKSAISKKILSAFVGKSSGTGQSDKPSETGGGSGSGTGLNTTIHELGHSGLGVGSGGSVGSAGSAGSMGSVGAAGKIDPQIIKNIVKDAPVPETVATSTSGTGGATGKGSKTGTPTVPSMGPGKFQTQIASMLPGIGMSLGGMLGFGSSGASMLGQVGGLLAGGIGMAFLAPGLLTSAFGGTIAGVGGAAASTGLGGAVAGLLTNPFTIAVAGALIIGAIIWGINSRRRREEKQRNQAMLDAFSQLDELLKQVNSDQIDGASAVTQANQVRKQYVDQMSQLKDGKTRRIALADVSRIDSRIAQIKQAADQQTARKAMDAKLVPTFADGGLVGTGVSGGHGYKVLGGDGAFSSRFRGRVPGIYDRKDDFLARLSGNEVVLTPDVWQPIAPYLKQKRVPGFAGGGMVDGQLSSSIPGSPQTSNNQEIIIEELTIHLNNQFGSETAARIVDIGLKTPGGQQAVVKSVRTHIGENGLGEGLVRDINRVNDRGF